MAKRIETYDTTLRDGTQARDITVSVEDKLILTRKLDEFGIDFIEGGMPGSNPKDEQYFDQVSQLSLQTAKIVAFGATARKADKVRVDDNIHKLLKSEAPIITLFGKTWRFHSKESLGISDAENADLIFNSVSYLKEMGREVFFDAEHFFDGYKDDPAFAIQMLKAAADGGASRLVLCDTNGGCLPAEVSEIVADVCSKMSVAVGIHSHNDGELAVANALAAIDAGAVHAHGTINGIGERCGNCNLCSLLPNLVLKKNLDIGKVAENIKKLTSLSHFFDEMTNQIPNHRMAFVGKSAFTHKGGIHVSSVLKDARMYEHIQPELVGNKRDVVISELSGKSNIEYLAKESGIDLGEDVQFSRNFVQRIKELEHAGFQFDGAGASLKLMLLKELKQYRPFFKITYAKVNDMFDENGVKYSESVMKIQVDGETEHTAADGNGPVNALDQAMRKALIRFYPDLKKVHLVDYKVRVLDGHDGTQAKVRVLIESGDKQDTWSTVGVSQDIIEASLDALCDSMNYKIYKDNLKSQI
ncbi:MAG: citramalate synthase [Deltaproteobacteria bacterium]|nr:citramalate synthase [Deltaproteobacteria bacterium]MBN2671491.1 citramalate synthase [Deltaproteobacteria bacterium]